MIDKTIVTKLLPMTFGNRGCCVCCPQFDQRHANDLRISSNKCSQMTLKFLISRRDYQVKLMKPFERKPPTGKCADKLFCCPAFSAPDDHKHRNQQKRYDDPRMFASYHGQCRDNKRDAQCNSGLGHSAMLAVAHPPDECILPWCGR